MLTEVFYVNGGFVVCYDQSFDIIFIVDGSVRMGRRNYPLMLDWIKDVGGNLNLK